MIGGMGEMVRMVFAVSPAICPPTENDGAQMAFGSNHDPDVGRRCCTKPAGVGMSIRRYARTATGELA
jgi:hypothetical protein